MTEKLNYLIFGATSDLAGAFIESVGHDARFTLVARNFEKIKALADRIGDAVSAYHVCDLADGRAVKDLIGCFRNDKVTFDGILCAAGGHEVRPLRLYKEDQFLKVFQQNFFTTSNILQSVSPVIAPGGSIVLISSAVTRRGAGAVSAYASAKAAVEALARAAAIEFSSKKVRVNVILPGVFRSQMATGFLSSLNEAQLESLRRSHLLGIGNPEDIIGSIKFLIGPDSKWMTGQSLVIDGGYSINA
jgi:NAD(P)-dependent dehydrogenase (short-subunit alcohol dehydrogenase family)